MFPILTGTRRILFESTRLLSSVMWSLQNKSITKFQVIQEPHEIKEWLVVGIHA